MKSERAKNKSHLLLRGQSQRTLRGTYRVGSNMSHVNDVIVKVYPLSVES